MARQATRLSDAGSTVNTGPATSGTQIMYNLKECLKQALWIHAGSGDGGALFSTTSGNANDKITGSGAGANGLDNTNAWWQGTDPSGNYQVLLQRGTTNRSWKAYFTRSGSTFTGGSPSATVTPTIPTDAIQAVGAAGAFNTTFFPATATWKAHVVAEDAATNGIYGFWLWFYEPVGPVVRGGLLYEPIAANSSPSFGDNPFVAFSSRDTANAFTASAGTITAASWKCYYRQASVRSIESLLPVVMSNSGGIVIPGGLPVYPYDSPTVEDGFAIWIALRASPRASKGLTGQIMWKGTSKVYPDTINLASATAYVFSGDLLIPWPTGVAPV